MTGMQTDENDTEICRYISVCFNVEELKLIVQILKAKLISIFDISIELSDDIRC